MSRLNLDSNGYYYEVPVVVVYGYNSFGPVAFEVPSIKEAEKVIVEEEYEDDNARLVFRKVIAKRYIPYKEVHKRHRILAEEPVTAGYYEYWDGTREFLKGTVEEFLRTSRYVGPGEKLVWRTPGTNNVNVVKVMTLSEYMTSGIESLEVEVW